MKTRSVPTQTLCKHLGVLLMTFLVPQQVLADGSDTSPVLQFAVGLPGKQVRLNWEAEPGVRYHVEKSSNLSADGGGWTRVALLQAAGPMIEWRDPQAVTERCFYRVSKPRPEVFSIEPPVLSMSGGALIIHGQRLPEGASVELHDEAGNLLATTPLFVESVGLWRADVEGTFPLGDGIFATVVGPGIIPQGATVPLLVTPAGYALDAPSNLPPAAPVPLHASNLVSGIPMIGIPGSGNRSGGLQPGSYVTNDDDDGYGLSGFLVNNGSASYRHVLKTRGVPNDDADFRVVPYDDVDTLAAPCDDDFDYSNLVAAPLDDDFDYSNLVAAPIDDIEPFAIPWDDSDGTDITLRDKGLGQAMGGIRRLGGPYSSHRIMPAAAGIPGEVSFRFDALSLPNPAGPPLAWVMTYRSAHPVSSGHGPQWDFSYNISIEPRPADAGSSAPSVVVRDGGGRADVFHRQADGTYRCDGMYREGSFTGDTFTLTFADQGKWGFNPLDGSPEAGKIASITDRNNVSLACNYDSEGLLTSVSDVFGRSLNVTWDSTDSMARIASVADSTGRTVHFTAYVQGEIGGPEGTLKSISCAAIDGTPPEAAPFVFTYTTNLPDPNLNNNLLSMTDGTGRLLESFTYHPTLDVNSPEYDRCATHDRHGGGHVTVMKSALNSIGGYTIYKVDEIGRLTETDCDRQHRVLAIRQFTGFCTPGVAADALTNRPSGKLRASDPDFFETSYTWNPDHALTQVTDPDGSQLRFVHQREFNPGGPVTERGNVRNVTLRSAEGGTRVVSFDYQPGFGTLENSMPGGSIKGLLTESGLNPGGGINPQGRTASRSAASPFEDDADLTPSLAGSSLSPAYALAPCIDDSDSFSMAHGGRSGRHTHFTVAKPGVGDSVSNGFEGGADFGEFSSVMDIIGGKGPTWQAVSMNNLTPRISRIVTAHGHEITWTYDSRGNPGSAASPIPGSGASYQYDAFGRCASVTIADGADSFSTEITYDDLTGMPATITTDPANLALTTQFDYDALGRCVRVIDPEGFDTLFEYLPSGRLARCESPPVGSSRIATTLHYDQACRLVRFDVENRDPDGAPHPTNSTYSSFFVYDARGRLVRIAKERRPVEVTVEITPDSLGIENFAVLDFQFNPAGEITRASIPAASRGEADDLVCDHQFDERGLLYRRILGGLGSPEAVVDQFDYSPAGLPVRSARLVDGATASEFQSDYDGFHRLSSITDPMGNVVHFSYDSRGGITREVFGEVEDAPGSAGSTLLSRSTVRLSSARPAANAGFGTPSVRSLFHTWPHRDDVITHERFIAGSSIPMAEETTVITRSPVGLVKQVSRNGDLLASFTHDSAGRAATYSNAAQTISMTRDKRGNIEYCGKTKHFRIGEAPPKTFTTTHEYDSLGRLVQSSDSSGNTVTRAFDSLGRLSHLTTAAGMLVTCDYDGSTESGPYSILVSRFLDGVDSPFTVTQVYLLPQIRTTVLKSVTDPHGHVTTATYDALGRKSRVDHPDGTYETFDYDSRGLLQQRRLTNGTTSEFQHDLNGRVVSVSLGNLPAGVVPVPETTYSYDGLGRLVRCDQGTSSVTLAWDSLGNRVGETQGDVTVSSTYDHRGRTDFQTSHQLRQAESRDSLGRLLAVSLVDEIGTVSPPVASFEHLGFTVCRTVSGNGVSTTLTYRSDGEAAPAGDSTFGLRPVRSVVAAGLGTVLSDSSITRNADQHVSSVHTLFSTDPAGPARTTSLVRDGMDRITGWTTTRREAAGLMPVLENHVSYTLDARGDRTTAIGGPHPGSYTKSTALPPGDAQRGRYTSWPQGPLEWDQNRNLTRIPYGDVTHSLQYDALGRLVAVNDDNTGAPIAEFSYDGLDRLLSLTVHEDGVPPAFTRFIYDGSICVHELGEDGVADLTYVVSDGVSRCISTRNGTIYYPHRGGASDIGPCDAAVITDAKGLVVEHRDCDGDGRPVFLAPDGLPTATGRSATPIRWMAPEALWLPETRFHHTHDTAFSPNLGTQVSKPPDKKRIGNQQIVILMTDG